MKKLLMIVTVAGLLAACNTFQKNEKMSSIDEKTILSTLDSICNLAPKTDTALLSKGIRNAAAFWAKEDGSAETFTHFCVEHFQNTPKSKAKLYASLERNLEYLYGYYNQISLNLKKPVQEVGPDYTPLDEDFAAFDPYAHLTDDLFQSKIAFSILLNFPFYTLAEKNELGKTWSRQEWAYARMGDLITSRIPALLNQQLSKKLAEAETYISGYNIHMDRLRTEDNRQLFPDSLALISHWGLRDELKSNYADIRNGLEKQRMIYTVMKHIISQSIPKQALQLPDATWKPYSNTMEERGQQLQTETESNERYVRLFENYTAMKALDPYCKSYPTALDRAFNRDMEVSAGDIKSLFLKLVSSSEIKTVAALIQKRLGRKLEPFDIWYDGFKSRSSIPEQTLTNQTRALYPDTKAFEKRMPDILGTLGFAKADAEYIRSKVVVDNARGSGHAWGAQMRTDVAHLRTRIQPEGMDYKGYNIAMHEFGHNVEQTISLNRVDHYLLNGIPSTAFTEALAFVFQKRDLEVLGYTKKDPNNEALQTLDIFWGCYEIMGVSLVEIETWEWLYEHPEATAETLKQALIRNARSIWNKYYAPVLGEKDSPILAIYSHMIEYPLYLSNYPYGHLVEFQLEKHFGNSKPGNEIQRIYKTGKLTPDLWQIQAVGQPVSVAPMLEAAQKAVWALN